MTGDMFAHQMSPALIVFILHHRDKMSFIDIVGTPFCEQSKEFQADYLRISMIHQLVRRKVYGDMMASEVNQDDGDVDE